jgi:hypothetical protein
VTNITLNDLLNPPRAPTPAQLKRARRDQENEERDAERDRLNSRSTWQKIYELNVDNDLKDILWAITEKLEI